MYLTCNVHQSFFGRGFLICRFKEETLLAPAQVRWALHLNHISNYITLLCWIINSSFLEVLRKYGLQLKMQVKGVTKYTLPRHMGAQKAHTQSDVGGVESTELGCGEQPVNQHLV